MTAEVHVLLIEVYLEEALLVRIGPTEESGVFSPLCSHNRDLRFRYGPHRAIPAIII